MRLDSAERQKEQRSPGTRQSLKVGGVLPAPPPLPASGQVKPNLGLSSPSPPAALSRLVPPDSSRRAPVSAFALLLRRCQTRGGTAGRAPFTPGCGPAPLASSRGRSRTRDAAGNDTYNFRRAAGVTGAYVRAAGRNPA